MGSIETQRIYAIDPLQWTVKEESAAPGKPWGMTATGDELRVLCGETAEDDRFIRQFIPGHGFKTSSAIPCPDNTGSHLSYDGKHLFVSQWYKKQLVELDAGGKPGKTLSASRGICGQVYVDGAFYLLTTDDEEHGEYFITLLDPHSVQCTDLAIVPFHARALAYDGTRFWTNHRAENQTVSFTLP